MIEERPGLPDVVTFSSGPQGSRSKLWSRVCQYVTDPERRRLCINQDADAVSYTHLTLPTIYSV